MGKKKNDIDFNEIDSEFVDKIRNYYNIQISMDKMKEDKLNGYRKADEKETALFSELFSYIPGFSKDQINNQKVLIKIKEHFINGENGDDFGFVNPETTVVHWNFLLLIWLYVVVLEDAAKVGIDFFANEIDYYKNKSKSNEL